MLYQLCELPNRVPNDLTLTPTQSESSNFKWGAKKVSLMAQWQQCFAGAKWDLKLEVNFFLVI